MNCEVNQLLTAVGSPIASIEEDDRIVASDPGSHVDFVPVGILPHQGGKSIAILQMSHGASVGDRVIRPTIGTRADKRSDTRCAVRASLFTQLVERRWRGLRGRRNGPRRDSSRHRQQIAPRAGGTAPEPRELVVTTLAKMR